MELQVLTVSRINQSLSPLPPKEPYENPLQRPSSNLSSSGSQGPSLQYHPPLTYKHRNNQASWIGKGASCMQATLVPGIKHQGLSFMRQAFPLASYIHLQWKSNHFIGVVRLCLWEYAGIKQGQKGGPLTPCNNCLGCSSNTDMLPLKQAPMGF